MACDCENRIKAGLLEKTQKEHPKSSNGKINLEGYGTGINEAMDLKTIAFMPYSYSADFLVKNGGVRRKTIKSRMIFNYCPFCGVRYEDKEVKKACGGFKVIGSGKVFKTHHELFEYALKIEMDFDEYLSLLSEIKTSVKPIGVEYDENWGGD